MFTKSPTGLLLRLCIGSILGLSAIAQPAWAGATLDGTMGTTGSFSGNFTIPDTVGQTQGSNLFHSFSDFSINAGESATFTGPAAIDNVISRVTGSNPSTFNGPLTSSIPSANFYFMNPNGMIFKEGASISVDGSFYATTSDSISLGADGVFFADPATTSTLTSSPPSAFGFLDNNPASIVLEGTKLVKDFGLIQPNGASFSLVAGDITLDQSLTGTNRVPNTFISMTGNRFEIVSVASAGEAVFDNGSYDLTSFDTLGDVTLTGSSVLDATDIYIRGGNIYIDDGLIAPGFFFVVGIAPDPLSGTIDIGARNLVSISGTEEFQVLRPDGGAYISGITAFSGNPLDGAPSIDGSDININATEISVSGLSAVANIRYGPGQAGNINITGESVAIRNGGIVTTINAFDGAGGDINVTADQVILDGEDHTGSQTGLNASSNFSVVYLATDGSVSNPLLQEYTTADAGTITVNTMGAGGLVISNGASISTESRAYGRGGDIVIKASNIDLSRDGKSVGAIASQSLFAGDAGNIDVHATGDINIRDGFEITANSVGTGTGGIVHVSADGAINISGESSGIASAAPEPTQNVKDLLGVIYNPVFGSTNFDELVAGINLAFEFEYLPPDASMYDVLGALQVLGIIDLNDPDPTAGDAGSVMVAAASLNMDGLSRITSSTSSDGNGGSVDIQVGELNMSNGAEIRSRSGLPDVLTGEIMVGSGNGGDIFVAADAISMQSDSSISVSSLGEGRAGNITINTGNTLNMSDSSITSQAEGSGDGGDIAVTASTASMSNASSISASSLGDGKAGNIAMNSASTFNMSDSSITSQAEGSGDGGDISIAASSSVTMQNSSSISASALGAGLAGNIAIDAGQRLEMSSSSISTQAVVSDGGNIDIMAVERILLDQSEITTSVESGFGAGGNINIDPEFVILKQSNILANAFGGPGGNINIVAGNFIATPDSVVDASSTLGIDGIVNISSPDEEISEDLAVLPDNFLDVTSLISERCATTAGASSLVDAGPGGLIVDPDGYLPSYATATDMDNEEEGDSNSVSSNRWWAPYSHQSALQIAQLTCSR